GLAATVLVGVVLEEALAGLVADGAIQRVIDEEVLHHRLLVLTGLGGVGVDDHAVGAGGLAGGNELGDGLEGVVVAGVGLPDLGQADAAGGHDGEAVVVAVLRNLD